MIQPGAVVSTHYSTKDLSAWKVDAKGDAKVELTLQKYPHTYLFYNILTMVSRRVYHRSTQICLQSNLCSTSDYLQRYFV